MDVHRQLAKNLLQHLHFLILLILTTHGSYSQVQTPPSAQKLEKSDKATRVGSVLTDVLVSDRDGRFVGDLKRDQFELLVDGMPQPIAFFELVTAGSPEEGSQWARAQGTEVPTSSLATGSNADGRRTLFFFLDDLHMSADSIKRVREAFLHFIDAAMGTHDRATIVAATRQIGLLQQLSSDKPALRAAVEQLTFRQPLIQDNQRPAMNEAQALAIEQHDSSVLDSFVDTTSAESHQTGKMARQKAEQLVRARAASLAKQSVAVTGAMLSSLSDLLRSFTDLPGRKSVFVFSDGFVLKGGQFDATDQLLEMTEAAARAGIVIYALDTGGSEAGRGDAAIIKTPNLTGGRTPSTSGEIILPPDGPRVLAVATGGRFLRYTGALDETIVKTLAETSRYYLLGWHIDPTMLQSGNSKSLKVSVKDHPDFTVRLRQSSIDLSKYVWQEKGPAKDTGFDELRKAIRSSNPLTALPVFLYPSYTYQPEKGQVLTILLQADGVAMGASAEASKEEFAVDIVGAVLNKNGATVDFFQGSLSGSKDPGVQSREKQGEFIRTRLVAIDPGVYQVRIAVRDARSGRTGSACEWIEVPPLPPGRLCLSSLYLRGPQVKEAAPTGQVSGPLPEIPPSVKRRFPAGSQLFFSMYIYNSVRPSDGSPPKILLQARIYKGDQAVIRSSLYSVKVEAGSGADSLPCEAGISLEGLSAGSYVLEVTATDQSNNNSATQRVSFWIE